MLILETYQVSSQVARPGRFLDTEGNGLEITSSFTTLAHLVRTLSETPALFRLTSSVNNFHSDPPKTSTSPYSSFHLSIRLSGANRLLFIRLKSFLLNPDVIAKAAELDCSYHARQVKRDVLCT
jgi:hypothetical protein